MSNSPETPAVPAETPEPLGQPRYTRDDMIAFADRIGQLITETPEQRTRRLRDEREQAFLDGGETEAQRKTRHRNERAEHQRRMAAVWRQHPHERVRRFRRWIILTAISASAGYALHLPQLIAHTPAPVQWGIVFATWSLDLYLRGWGRTRVSEVRGKIAIPLTLAVRVPLASALLTVGHLTPLLATTTH